MRPGTPVGKVVSPCRVAELMEQHDRWWAEPGAVAEAVALWGRDPNEHGVITQHERIEVAGPSPRPQGHRKRPGERRPHAPWTPPKVVPRGWVGGR